MTHKSSIELAENIQAAYKGVDIDTEYMHYKDSSSRYRVLGFVIIEATTDVAVRYSNANHQGVEFVRPLYEWQEQLDHEGQIVTRFTPVNAA